MKRVIIAVLLIFGISKLYSQEMGAPSLNYSRLEKMLEKSNEEIVDEKDKVKAKTWFDRGELFQDIHDVNIEFLRIGMMQTEAKLLKGEPNEIRTIQEGGVVTEEHVYDRVDLIYRNNVLEGWLEKEVLHPDPLPEALKAYNKALELDEKGKLGDKIKENLERMKAQAESDAILAFTTDDYKTALAKFELILDVSKADVYEGFIDSVIIYNSALAARNAGEHDKAAHYFERSSEINYGGSDTYYLLKNEYVAMKDSLKALDALERGYALYPDSTLLIFELVNYHLTAGNSEEGMIYLTKAEELAGDNPSIYFAKGTLFEKLGDKEKAYSAYQQALEVDPEFFNAWFNIGALHFNSAVEMYDAANAIEDLDEYNKAKSTADEELRKAIEPLNKAHAINKNDVSCLETLSTIYYRLQMNEEREAIQAKIDALK